MPGVYHYSMNQKYKYEGEFVNDVRHGIGKCWFENGDFYEGEWKSDEQHGQGVFIYSKGRG